MGRQLLAPYKLDFYYVTKAFCPESPDEERMAHDAIEGFPWNIEHR